MTGLRSAINRAGVATIVLAVLSILVVAALGAGLSGAIAGLGAAKIISGLAVLTFMGLTSVVPGSDITALSASGAVTPGKGLFPITKAGVAVLTLALPAVDGYEMVFVDEGGHAHTITIAADASPPTAGLNGGGVTIATFNGTKGSAVKLISRNGSWWAVTLTGVSLS